MKLFTDCLQSFEKAALNTVDEEALRFRLNIRTGQANETKQKDRIK